jgi:Fungal chitosanase of glycosyl hydrolase group 75
VKLNVPKPHRSIEELRKLNEKIDAVLPGLGAMLEKARVSPVFDALYGLKVKGIRENIERLDQLLSRHNFFDCETILELQSPTTKRRALLIQSDMDVDTDGTDGDRIPVVDGGSRTFQPFTSYRWKKRTPNPNPCAPIWEKRIADNEARIKDPKTSAADVQSLKSDTARLRRELADLRNHSYLVGAVDPFIVLPSQMFSSGKTGFHPRMGDYCVVVVGEVFYPAIIGDAGPRTKIGEASLRICRQISAKANGETRPLNDLKATYLVFPNTAEKNWGPPDLKLWSSRCDALLKEFGGYNGVLFQWEDLTRPAVEPPAPAPSPAVTPSAPATTPPPAAAPSVPSPTVKP